MKRLLLSALLCFVAIQGFSNGMLGILGGAGLSTSNNYDIGGSYGLMGFRGVYYRTGLGLSLTTQQYNLYYDREISNSNVSGTSLRTNLNYGFLSPMFVYDMHKKDGRFKLYVSAGVGYNIGGYDSLHKWNRSGIVAASYDSSLDESKNVNKVAYRIGVGMLQFFPMGKHLTFCLNEDIGFLANKISSTSDDNDALLKSNLSHYYKPAYVSIRLGIFFR